VILYSDFSRRLTFEKSDDMGLRVAQQGAEKSPCPESALVQFLKSAPEPIHIGILVAGQLLRIIIREAFLG